MSDREYGKPFGHAMGRLEGNDSGHFTVMMWELHGKCAVKWCDEKATHGLIYTMKVDEKSSCLCTSQYCPVHAEEKQAEVGGIHGWDELWPNTEESARRLGESFARKMSARRREIEDRVWAAVLGKAEPDLLEDPGEFHRRKKMRFA